MDNAYSHPEWHVKNKTIGHVYQRRYKSFPIEKDNYFLQVCRYVERNSLRARLVQKAEDWRWSSLWIRSYGTDKQKTLLSPWPVNEPNTYLQWVNDSLNNEEEELGKIRNSIKGGCPLGRESWVREVAEKLGLNATLNPRGRPKKGTCDPISHFVKKVPDPILTRPPFSLIRTPLTTLCGML